MVEEKIKQEGEGQLRQRQLVAASGMDADKCWRIDSGDQRTGRNQVVSFAWMSGKVVYEGASEQNAVEALKAAKEKIKYQNTKKRLCGI